MPSLIQAYRKAETIFLGAAALAVTPVQFVFRGGKRWIRTSERIGAIAGLAAGVGLMIACPPLALVGGVAGAFVLSVANWNGSVPSKALSCAVGFVTGCFVGLPITLGLVGAAAVKSIHNFSRVAPEGAASAPEPAATEAPAAGSGLSQNLGKDFAPAATQPAAEAKGDAPKAPATPRPPKA